MAKFRTENNYKSPKMPVYGKEEPIYQVQQVPLKNGAMRPVEVGKTNIYERIQKSCGFRSVKELVERYERGDIQALNKRQGFYGDISKMPACLNDVNAVVRNAQSTYHTLPKDVKAMFGSYENFIASVSDGTYLSKIMEVNKNNEPIDKNSGNSGVPVLQKGLPEEKKPQSNEQGGKN